MKKISLLVFFLALALTLVGCQSLGDKLNGKYTNEPVNEAVNNSNTPAITNAEVKDNQTPTAAVKYNNIFFGSTKYDPKGENCYGVYWVHIQGDDSVAPVERNLKLLLAGPTAKWQALGYYSFIPAGTKLNSVKTVGDTITADFSAELGTLTDKCVKTQAKQQIVNTAKYAAQEQLSQTITKVIVTVDGKEF